MKKNSPTFYVGVFLLAVFILQLTLDLKWHWLVTLQENDQVKLISGLMLGSFIAFQWQLTFLRLTQNRKAKLYYSVHRTIGYAGPLIFYIHSTTFGYAYLAVLSGIYFANIVLGLIHTQWLPSRQKWITYSWLVAHCAFSVIVVVLMAYHGYIILIYN
jgi:methionine sulfoxide reductase heme-binding subunit